MYKEETLSNYEAKARELVEFYHKEILAGRIPEVRLSKGNVKIGDVWNFSTLAIITCGNCGNCKKFCYAVKDAVRFPVVLENRAINTALLWYAPASLYEQLTRFFNDPRIKNKVFRADVSGELTPRLFSMLTDIATAHPDWKMWTYTKMYGIVNRWLDANGALPSNFSVMFSKWDGMPVTNPHGLPVFAVKMKAGNIDPMDWGHMFKCVGNCQYCIAHNCGCIKGEDTYNDEH